MAGLIATLLWCLLSALPGHCHVIVDRQSQSQSLSPNLARRASYEFNPLATDLNIVYYGQANITGKVSLTEVCSDDSIDVVILGFIKSFYQTGNTKNINITMSLKSCDEPSTAQEEAGQIGLLDCVSGGFADEIANCQKLGKKVLISAGSASGDLYIPSSKAASNVAKELWNMFFAGTDSKIKPLRPFGDVVLDGFDLDNEDAANTKYLPKLVSSLRSRFKKDKSKTYYISSAPICALPDDEIPTDKLINYIDFWNVQFYNAQACQLGSGNGFISALKQWSTLLLDGRKVKCVGDTCSVPKGKFNTINNGIEYPRLLIGTRAFYASPKSGYVSPETYKSLLEEVKKLVLPNLAGAMFWDGAWQYLSAEDVDGTNMTFAEVARDVL